MAVLSVLLQCLWLLNPEAYRKLRKLNTPPYIHASVYQFSRDGPDWIVQLLIRYLPFFFDYVSEAILIQQPKNYMPQPVAASQKHLTVGGQ